MNRYTRILLATYSSLLVSVGLTIAQPAICPPDDAVPDEPVMEDVIMEDPEAPQMRLWHTGVVVPTPSTVGVPFSTGDSSSGVMIVPSAKTTPEKMAEIRQDMGIMSRILRQRLQKADVQVPGDIFNEGFGRYGRTGFDFPFFGNKSNDLYIADFGPVFVIEVDLPLSGDTASEPEQTQTTSGTDKVWEQMRREMLEPKRYVNPSRKTELYDPEKVEDLKRSVIEALRHTVNIRTMGSDPWVVVYVRSTHEPENMITQTVNSGGRSEGRVLMEVRNAGISTLVFRASRADIADFSAGKLTPDQFKQKVAVIAF